MKIRMCIIVCVLVPLTMATLSRAAEETVGQKIANGVGRGMVNVVTSPGEFGHHISYDTASMNVLGVFTGFGKGAVYMLGRIFAGMADVITLGYIPEENSLYKSMHMQEYVWEEKWLPPKTIEPVTSSQVIFDTQPAPTTSVTIDAPVSVQSQTTVGSRAARKSQPPSLQPMEKVTSK